MNMMDAALIIVFLLGLGSMLGGVVEGSKTLYCIGTPLLVVSIILISIHVTTPTAMDIYKGKTELSYTIVMHGDSIEHKDSCVIYKK